MPAGLNCAYTWGAIFFSTETYDGGIPLLTTATVLGEGVNFSPTMPVMNHDGSLKIANNWGDMWFSGLVRPLTDISNTQPYFYQWSGLDATLTESSTLTNCYDWSFPSYSVGSYAGITSGTTTSIPDWFSATGYCNAPSDPADNNHILCGCLLQFPVVPTLSPTPSPATNSPTFFDPDTPSPTTGSPTPPTAPVPTRAPYPPGRAPTFSPTTPTESPSAHPVPASHTGIVLYGTSVATPKTIGSTRSSANGPCLNDPAFIALTCQTAWSVYILTGESDPNSYTTIPGTGTPFNTVLPVHGPTGLLIANDWGSLWTGPWANTPETARMLYYDGDNWGSQGIIGSMTPSASGPYDDPPYNCWNPLTGGNFAVLLDKSEINPYFTTPFNTLYCLDGPAVMTCACVTSVFTPPTSSPTASPTVLM